VLVTSPGQLHDVDPSRSSELVRVDGQGGGHDPKPFDAGLTTSTHLSMLEINRPFESWVVLGRTGGGVDLLDVFWKDGALSGRSPPVRGEPYEIFMTEDATWRLAEMQCRGAAPRP
jgi:hypothetical protein